MAVPRAPDCDIKSIGPFGGRPAENEAFIGMYVLITPRQFGPIRRIWCWRAISMSSCSLSRPSMLSPVPFPKGDRYIGIGRINTRYRAFGPVRPGSRSSSTSPADSPDTAATPILLLHGLAGFLEIWERNIPALSEHFRVFAPDLAGFGRSDKPEAPYDFSFFARFIRNLMDGLEIERAHLIGHSLGGGAALRFAILYPDRIHRLVLIGSAGLGRRVNLFLRLCTVPLVGELLSRPTPKGAELGLRTCVHDPDTLSEHLIDTARAMAEAPGLQRSFLSTVRALGNLGGLREDALHPVLSRLNEINAPTLAVWGGRDRILPPEHLDVLAAGIPHASRHIFPGCGHMPQWEAAEEFNRLVLDFFLAAY